MKYLLLIFYIVSSGFAVGWVMNPLSKEQLDILNEASRKKSSDLCLRVEDYRGACILHVAFQTKDTSHCDKFENLPEFEKLPRCYGLIANLKKDKTLCDRFVRDRKNPTFFKKCLTEFYSCTVQRWSSVLGDAPYGDTSACLKAKKKVK